MDRSQAALQDEVTAGLAALASAVAGDVALRTRAARALTASTGIAESSLEALIAAWPRGFDLGAMRSAVERLRTAGRLLPRRVALIAPGNLPMACWTAMAELLALGAEVRVRPGSGDREGPAVFRRWLSEAAPALAARVAICQGDRLDLAAWANLVDGCDAAVVFGGDAAVQAVTALLRRLGYVGPVRGHGHKVSLGLVDGAAVERGAAGGVSDAELRALWRAALLADGRGCLSLRALLVRGSAQHAATLAARLAVLAPDVAQALPAGALAPDLLAARRVAIEEARLAAVIGTGLLCEADAAADAGASWATGTHGTARRLLVAGELGPGARWLPVIPIDAASPLTSVLAPLRGQIAALALPRAHLEAEASAARQEANDGLWAVGVDRICHADELQSPPWHQHDGVPLGQGLAPGDALSGPFSA